MITDIGKKTGIILCRCSISQAMPEEQLGKVDEILGNTSNPLLIIDDLCGQACEFLSGGQGLAQTLPGFLKQCEDVLIVACEPRAVRSLLLWAGISPLLPVVQFLSLRSEDTPTALRRALELTPGEGTTGTLLKSSTPWVPWFPVIDPDACVNCGKCLEFCLFGVYEKKGDQVIVRHPQNCKNNCPACARVCPVNAVIFPKFGKAPINGAPVETKSLASSSGSMLAERKEKRRRLFSDTFAKELEL